MANPLFIQRDPLSVAFDGLSSVASGYLKAEEVLRKRYENDRDYDLKVDAFDESVRQFDTRHSELARQFDLSFEEGVREFDSRLSQSEDHFTRGQDFQGSQNELDREHRMEVVSTQQSAETFRQRKRIESIDRDRAQQLRASASYLDIVEQVPDESLEMVTLPDGSYIDPDSAAHVLGLIDRLSKGDSGAAGPGVAAALGAGKGEDGGLSVEAKGKMRDEGKSWPSKERREVLLRDALPSYAAQIKNGTMTPRQALDSINTFAPDAGYQVTYNETLAAQHEAVAMQSTTGDWDVWNRLSNADKQAAISRVRSDRGRLPQLRREQLEQFQNFEFARTMASDPNMAQAFADPVAMRSQKDGKAFGANSIGQPVFMPWNMQDQPHQIQRAVQSAYAQMGDVVAGNRTEWNPTVMAENSDMADAWTAYEDELKRWGSQMDIVLRDTSSAGAGGNLAEYYIEASKGGQGGFQVPITGVSPLRPASPGKKRITMAHEENTVVRQANLAAEEVAKIKAAKDAERAKNVSIPQWNSGYGGRIGAPKPDRTK